MWSPDLQIVTTSNALIPFLDGSARDFVDILVRAEVVEHKAGEHITHLRSPDGHVRHKILDLIGDLALLPAPLQGSLSIYRPGHALNRERMLLQSPRGRRRGPRYGGSSRQWPSGSSSESHFVEQPTEEAIGQGGILTRAHEERAPQRHGHFAQDAHVQGVVLMMEMRLVHLRGSRVKKIA